MKQTFQIVRARPENAAALTEIAFTAKRHWDYPEQWIESWSALLTISPMFILHHETYAAVGQDCTLGFYAICFQDDQLRLEHLWVIPQAMGLGIGRSLFTHAVQMAGQLGFQELLTGFLSSGRRASGQTASTMSESQGRFPLHRCQMASAKMGALLALPRYALVATCAVDYSTNALSARKTLALKKPVETTRRQATRGAINPTQFSILEKGQIWKARENYVLIGDAGKRFIEYKIAKQPKQRGLRNHMASVKTVQAFLKSNRARLVVKP